MSRDNHDDYCAVFEHADCLFGPEEVLQGVARTAEAVTAAFKDRDPLVLCVMTGGFRFCSDLLGLLQFPLELDYLHVSRYRDETRGGTLNWLRSPQRSLEGRHVLVVDDILDEGVTLAAVCGYCADVGAASVATAVLVDKRVPRQSMEADFVALTAPDRYLFGEGMDFKGYGRNLRGIYAVGKAG